MTTLKMKDGYSLEDVVRAVMAVLQPEEPEEQEPEPEEVFVPESTVKKFKSFDDYPDFLQARHVRQMLGISEAIAYEILNSKKCPTLRMTGKRLGVRKEAFLEYLKAHEGGEESLV